MQLVGYMEATSRFDELVSKGKIQYDPHQRIVRRSDDGFAFEFRITAGWDKKPLFGDAPSCELPPERPSSPSGAATTLIPGSDIDVSGYELGNITDTHFLAFNKFSVYRPHILLMTRDGFRRQTEPLDEQDLCAAWHALQLLRVSNDSKNGYMVMFNGGEAGGCSRMYKHLQLIPRPPPNDSFVLWPDGPEAHRPHVPVQHFLHHFANDPSPRELAAVYSEMMAQTRELLQIQGENAYVPHNIVLTRQWLLVVPRVRSNYLGAFPNAVGYLGIVWLRQDAELEKWMNAGPLRVLTETAVQRGRDTTRAGTMDRI